MAFVDVMLKETDGVGLNQGLLELASGFEVADYVHQPMRDTFPASGRVSFHPRRRWRVSVAAGPCDPLAAGGRDHDARLHPADPQAQVHGGRWRDLRAAV
jgi:hypothetical protein